MKKCSKCGVEKDLSEFYLQRGKPRAACKKCNEIRLPFPKPKKIATNCGRCNVILTSENCKPSSFKLSWALCHSCINEYNRTSEQSKKLTQNATRWSREHKERRKEIVKKWDNAHRVERTQYAVNSQRKQKYGITPEEFQAKFEKQGGLCEICKKPMTLLVAKSNLRACQDHDHVTGKNRDLLCSSCNLLLGNCFEKEDILSNAIFYLRKHSNESSSETALEFRA
jgi:Autographiviridae endonuclease VII